MRNLIDRPAFRSIGFLALVASSAPSVAAAQGAAGEPKPGELAFRQRCATCHAIVDGENRYGPYLFGVAGRVAGTARGYGYSASVKQAGTKGLRWTATTLDPFLADPVQYIRTFIGQADARHRMPIRLQDSAIRAEIAAYVLTLGAPPPPPPSDYVPPDPSNRRAGGKTKAR
jgi:cytochrome c